MHSTIDIFRRLYAHIPPLFPSDVAEKMGHALEHLERDETITVAEVEDTMIRFGYELWPWNQAYREFLVLAESQVGEHFLLPKLNKSLRGRYLDFKRYGGDLRELHSGRPADFFSPEERGELCGALVDLQHELRHYVDRSLIGLEKTRYLRRVNEFKGVLAEIQKQLDVLNKLAESEQDHPTLADEIRSSVRHFQYGLCLLGPDLDYDAVCRMPEYYRGRKQDLNRMRGIHVPAEVEFYN